MMERSYTFLLADNKPLHLIPGGRPEGGGELARLRAEIEARDRQETAISELGQAALTGVDAYILLGQACALVELTLGVDHCRVLEITPAGRVVLRASIGSNTTFNHCERDEEENESIALYVSLAGAPVVFNGLDEETRFKSTHLRDYHRIRAGAGVVIPSAVGAFGVLLAYSSAERVLADYEIAFLRSTASLLGEAFERNRAEQALRKSESRLTQLIASTLDAVVSVDGDGTVIEWNPQAEAVFGRRAREVLGRPIPPGIIPQTASAGLPRRVETIGRRVNGEEFPMELTIEPVGSGAEQTLTAFIRDISERKRAQEELERREQRFRAIVERSWSGVLLLNQDLGFTYAAASTERLLGYTEEDLRGASILGFVHPRERHTTRQLFRELLDEPNRDMKGELRFLHKNGSWVWLEGFAQNLLHDPAVGAVVVNYRDITQRKQTEKQLEYQAYYDALTGLPNRLLFRDRVVTAIAQAMRNRRGIAVMYLDLDHFKLVNDGLGHSIGDALLAQVAERLQVSVRSSDTISRLGGDEFTLLLNDVGSSDSVATVAHKILQSLSRPFRVGGHELFVTASIGISLFPSDGTDVETLLKAADSAMYRAKELGRNQAQLFTASMNERYVRRLSLEQSLHHAIERRELELHYQPVYERARRPVSVEALIRWNHPTRGLVPPADFITLAEETGLIVPLGEWVVREVCAQLRRWHDGGLSAMKAAINISAPQLQQRAFTDIVMEALRRNGLEPSSLQIEITESVAVQNIDFTMKVLQELRDRGVGIAIDDFGTGQSSLVYLRRFPIDTVKIDRTFVHDVTTDESAAAIVSYVINLAHTLRFQVVAEGVESEDQYNFLRLNGCDKLQGYLFSAPRPAGEIEEFVKSEIARAR